MEFNPLTGSKSIQRPTLGSHPKEEEKDESKIVSTTTHTVKKGDNNKPEYLQQSDTRAAAVESLQTPRTVTVMPSGDRHKKDSLLRDCATKTCQQALETYYKGHTEIYANFLSVDSPNGYKGSSPQILKILPLCTGIFIDLVLNKMSELGATAPVDLTKTVFSNKELTSSFRNFFTFSNAKNPYKLYGSKLFTRLEEKSLALFQQITDGIIEHRNILPSLQETLDSHPLTKGFPARHFVMLFGSEDDCLLGPDAHNFGPFTMHGVAIGIKALLESLAPGTDIPEPDLSVFVQLRESVKLNVKTQLGVPIDPANTFAVGHTYHTPRNKFSTDGIQELLTINVKLDSRFSRREDTVLSIRGINVPNDKYPSKVTITAYSGRA